MLNIRTVYLGVVLGFIGWVLYGWQPVVLETLDLAAQDAVHAQRTMPAPHAGVAVVSVDETSIARLGRWPWSRDTQAQLLQAIHSAGAALVALDIVYSSPQSLKVDKLLASTVEQNKTVGGYFFRNEQSIVPSKEALAKLRENRIAAVFAMEDGNEAIGARADLPYVETNINEIQQAFSALGFFNYIPDADGLLRRIPLVLSFEGKYYPSLALQSLAHLRSQPIVLETRQGMVETVKLGQSLVPTDDTGKMVLSFYHHDAIPVYPAAAVLAGKHAADLQGKLVFVGVSEVGIADVRPTPTHPSFPGVLAHAVAASNILQSHYAIKNQTTMLFDVAALFSLPVVLLLWLSYVKGLRQSLLLFALLVVLFCGLYYWLLAYQGWLVSVVYPMVLLSLTFISHQIWFNLVSQKHNRFLKNAFASYVAPAVVDTIIDNQQSLALGGKSQELTLLFSDIRDFTAMSEQLTPPQLVSVLNQYMDTMTRIVMAEQGTLDKYIGDAMMVLYNAPIALPDHPKRAATSALLMVQALAQVNQSIQAIAPVQLSIGVGVHTGCAVVGNMGSDIRFDYTAIGDDVNLAARLEAATKIYGVTILVSEVSYQAIREDFFCREVDRLQVKGKQQAIAVYELIGQIESMSQQQAADCRDKVQAYERCMRCYYQQDFCQAIDLLTVFLSDYPADGPATVLLARCHAYQATPPSKHWNGVYVATSK